MTHTSQFYQDGYSDGLQGRRYAPPSFELCATDEYIAGYRQGADRQNAVHLLERTMAYVNAATNSENGNDMFDAYHILVAAHQSIFDGR